METVNRRGFLARAAAMAASGVVTAASIDTLAAYAARADTDGDRRGRGRPGGYGPLDRKRASNTGEELLALPHGFHYVVFGVTGTMMSDGTPTPIAHDGMAAFPGPRGVRLIRNHEVRTTPASPVGRVLAGPDSSRYDLKGVGGTTTLDFNSRRNRLEQDFVSLNGTIVNCAGGIMLAGQGWVTCEETTAGPAQGWDQKHGYCYIVPLDGPEPGMPATSVPIPEMGRFSHEALAVDPATGCAYLTEDQSGRANGFFRFRPTNRSDLTAGGVLEMLRVTGVPNYDTREGQTVGAAIPVEWVVIDDPDPALEQGATPVTPQGLADGAAIFNRLEGCWYGNGSILFTSTSGGDVKNGDSPNPDGYLEGYGQVWQHTPNPTGGTLRLIYESTGPTALDSPDNLVFTPRGGILLCEDDASSADGDPHPLAPGLTNVNRLIGLDRNGQPFEFAVNIADDSEFAGACFSPNGRILFVNTFGESVATDPPGRTYAITGPWTSGPL